MVINRLIRLNTFTLFGWANQPAPAAAAAGRSPHTSTVATVQNSQLQWLIGPAERRQYISQILDIIRSTFKKNVPTPFLILIDGITHTTYSQLYNQ